MSQDTWRGWSRWSAMLLGALLGIGVVTAVYAQAGLTPDYTCRTCHGETERVLALPSGEQKSLRVDLGVFDASVHGHAYQAARGEDALSCRSCHVGTERYRFPHAPNPAQTLADFRAEVEGVCQDCHYPHLPFHDAATLRAAAPTCTDCHGSHDIAPLTLIAEVMPANCLACHTDQTEAWAATALSPRPGLGVGAAGFAGSKSCDGCHAGLYATWHTTLHARVVQDPTVDPSVLLADFEQAHPLLTFSQDDVRYVIGSSRRQVFLTEVAEPGQATDPGEAGDAAEARPAPHAADLVLLPAQWTVATGAWEPLYGDGGAGEAWLPSCAGCHVTGLDLTTGGFTEFGVGCESCHGPAAAHAADPENVKPFAQVDDQVCGACHSRGESPDGHPYPTTYRPGESLAAHFAPTLDAAARWPDGSARLNHQQYMDWTLGNTMALAEGTACITCHAVHGDGEAAVLLRQPGNELCLSCHNDQRALVRHIPFHENAIRSNDFYCTDCHMPKLASGAQDFDLRSHTFLQPNPQASVFHGGIEAMPNACNTCHTDRAMTPQWAAEIVAFAVAQATPSTSRFFGPGPTPTSPPPPTPVPSAGIRAEIDLTPPLWWFRPVALGILGAMVLAGVVYAVKFVRERRRTGNV